MFTFWLVLHVLFAIVLFGSSFAFPHIGMVVQKGGDPKTGLKIMSAVAHKMLLPADFLMPLTGAMIILSSKGVHDPFAKHGRWLLSSIILYIILFVIVTTMQVPKLRKAVALAEAGNMGPEFGTLMESMKKTGPILGILIIIIATLMVWKPQM